ncbi:MAG: hypothetical protein GYA17_20530, partial [Chloroflexi bacterium]|nr:hypothetical protein [Chloroflexota bacterium]
LHPAQPGAGQPAQSDAFHLDGQEEADVHYALDQVHAQFGNVAAFIHLQPADADSSKNEAWIRQVFLLAKALKPDLARASFSGRAAFITVTRQDGRLGLGSETSSSPISGGLAGLVKSLNLEWENIHCRAVDLQPDTPASASAGLILAEFDDPNRLVTEVAYNPEGRFTLVAEAELPG